MQWSVGCAQVGCVSGGNLNGGAGCGMPEERTRNGVGLDVPAMRKEGGWDPDGRNERAHSLHVERGVGRGQAGVMGAMHQGGWQSQGYSRLTSRMEVPTILHKLPPGNDPTGGGLFLMSEAPL